MGTQCKLGNCSVLCVQQLRTVICTLISIQLLLAIGKGMGIYTSEKMGIRCWTEWEWERLHGNGNNNSHSHTPLAQTKVNGDC